MPTTRAARAAAARAARCLTEVLPADALGLVLYQLPLAHDIAAVAPTCHVLCDAVKLTMKLRPFSGEVVTLAGHMGSMGVYSVAVAPDGRIFTGSFDKTFKVWRDGACERTIEAHTDNVWAMVALPSGGHFVSGSADGTAKLWTLDGALERTFQMDSVLCAAALPDAVHFVVGLSNYEANEVHYEVRLYHVDGTLVHTFKGHAGAVYAVAVTPDAQHVISGSGERLVKVWCRARSPSCASRSSARRSRASACA